ncbi:MAG TPA: response regulator [Bryobacteraceae bacterium]|nr:response regulator [Bryobacteraceae bacterium]
MANCSPQTILVVDDQTPVRQLISRMLTRSGFHTIEAGNGAQALAQFEDEHCSIDLAIIDMIMPRMSGLDVAAELSRQHPEVKILYLSPNSASIASDCIRRRAPQHLLLKPFTERSLVDRVQGLLAAQGDHQIVSSATEPV